VITATQHYRHRRNISLPFYIKNPARPPDTYKYSMLETTQLSAAAGFSGSQSSLEEPEREGLLRLTKVVEHLFRVPEAVVWQGVWPGPSGTLARDPITVGSGLPRRRPFGQVTDCSWVRW
jgi:hypothetical protein